MRPPRPLEERFWEKVDRRSPDECWPWTGAQYWSGELRYGQIRKDGGQGTLGAHRVSASLAGLEVPDGHEHNVHHICGNTLCVNPAHLLVVSAKDHQCLHHPLMWSRERVIECIKEFKERYGVLPTSTDWNAAMAKYLGHDERVQRWNENKWPATNTVIARFGSWSNAIEAAGFPRPGLGRKRKGESIRSVLSA